MGFFIRHLDREQGSVCSQGRTWHQFKSTSRGIAGFPWRSPGAPTFSAPDNLPALVRLGCRSPPPPPTHTHRLAAGGQQEEEASTSFNSGTLAVLPAALCVTCSTFCVTYSILCVTYSTLCVTFCNLCVTFCNLCVTFCNLCVT